MRGALAAKAARVNYDCRSELIGKTTPSMVSAALRLVGAITRPITVSEALNSRAVAHGFAAAQFEDEDTHDAAEQNSEGSTCPTCAHRSLLLGSK